MMWHLRSSTFFFIISFAFVCTHLSFLKPLKAQEELNLDDIELYLDNEEKKTKKTRVRRKRRSVKKEKIAQVSDLANLAPFSQVAVIQPRYLRKTGKFEGFAGGTVLMNDAFFNNMGGVVKLGYYFTEKWGVEGSAFFLSSSEKEVTSSLSERSIVTESLVTPEGFYGLDLKWVPIYGKMAFFNERIIPFDLYFSVGLGLSKTNQSDGSSSSATTFKVGTGQIFALNKWSAFRWDFSWHFFQPEVSSEGVSNSSGTVNNLFILLGFSFFLPEKVQ